MSAGTGKNVSLLALNLSSHGLGLYGHDSNAADHGDGNLMTKSVLGQLHADDFVITLDLSHDLARSVADGNAGLTLAPVPSKFLEHYRGDRFRAANLNDALRVAKQIIAPRAGLKTR